ncbi:hypothetical protein [Pseudomonas sp. JUb96]|uniref:hypothetical protein n=1 Tax=Pseudomonas sp. JUb96 TaxID=2940539 RepID=UPI002227CC81|nr:hypothetical protein [Pseudomonas sp. JUb96]MCW2270053.1 hypothetical protein [Pseudomonas sp. JUb96]
MCGDNCRTRWWKGLRSADQTLDPAQVFVVDLSQQVLDAGMGMQAFIVGLEEHLTGDGGQG